MTASSELAQAPGPGGMLGVGAPADPNGGLAPMCVDMCLFPREGKLAPGSQLSEEALCPHPSPPPTRPQQGSFVATVRAWLSVGLSLFKMSPTG